MYDPEKFIDLLLAKAPEHGFTESEVFFESSDATELQVLNQEVSMYESSAIRGVSFRGRKNSQMGYAYSEVMTDESVSFLLEQASQNASVLEIQEEETVYEGDTSYEVISSYSDEITGLTFSELANTALSLEKSILSRDTRIKAVDHCVITYGSSSLRIKNTKGLNLSHRSNLMFLYANARCEENDMTKTGSAYRVGRNLSILKTDDLSSEVAENTLEKLSAESVTSGTYTIILDAEAAADLLSTFAGIFSADMIQKGFSLLAGRIGQKIASEVVSIRDDATTPLCIGGIPFDSEGVATKKKMLVERGVLVSVLHNRKTAAKDNTVSTGNGFRSGFKGSISVGTTNFYIVPGQNSKEELLSKAKNGLYIRELSGLHAGANTVSGDFSLSCEGFLITNGSIGRAIDQITIADNFYTFLQKIDAVGADIFFDPPSDAGSVGSPSLLLNGISISGE